MRVSGVWVSGACGSTDLRAKEVRRKVGFVLHVRVRVEG